MNEFLLIETDKEMTENEILNHSALTSIASDFTIKSIIPVKKHILSHQHLYATFYELVLKKPLKHKSLFVIKRAELTNYALPQLITKYLEAK